ncbi:MAG: replicative DNA helicase [Patescibacteria group bacterium]|jgi:replicative DNA helicase
MENQNDVVEKLPPRNKEAEKSVLGSLLIDKDAIIKVSDFLRSEDFYEEKNSMIFSSMLELYEKREPIDVVSLANSLTDKGHLDLIGGRSYLVSLANIVPTAGNIIHYAKIVQRKSTLRKLITAAGDISRLGYQEGKDIEKLLDEAEQKLFGISQKYLKQNFIVIKDVLTDAFERIDELHRDGSKLRGIPTGFPDLDNVLAGFQRSDLIILAARPSMGKCVTADTEIIDPETGSMLTIEKAYKEKLRNILTLNNELKIQKTEISNYLDDHIKPVYEIETALGYKIKTTLTHPFLTIDGWKPLLKLKAGQRIGRPRVIPIFGKKSLESHKVKCLAYFIADGGLTTHCPIFTNNNKKIISDFQNSVTKFPNVKFMLSDFNGKRTPSFRVSSTKIKDKQKIKKFGELLKTFVIKTNQKQMDIEKSIGLSHAGFSAIINGHWLPTCETLKSILDYLKLPLKTQNQIKKLRNELEDSNSVTKWLKQLDLMGKSAGNKFVPEIIFSLKKEFVALFLNRLFSCDGSAYLGKNNYGLSYSSISEKLIKQIQHLLLRFGIISKLRIKKIKYNNEVRTAFEIEIRNKENISRFAKEIGIFGKEKQLAKLEKFVNKKTSGWTYDTLPIEVWHLVKKAKGKKTWQEIYKKLNLPLTHNIHAFRRNPRRETIKKLATVLKSKKLLELAESDIVWDKIKSIKYIGKKQVYDLSINSTHNFIANDFLVHNTSLALDFAKNIAKQKIPVGIFSLEMSKEQLVDRILCSEANVDLWRMRTGKLSDREEDDDFPRIGHAMGVLSEAPLFIDDSPSSNIMEIRTKARRLHAEHGLGFLVVDYLQLMEGRNTESRVQEVSEISRALKGIARELNVPVLALSQLSRAVENRTPQIPQLSDLRESGSIEQDADVVMFIYREEVYKKDTDRKHIAEIHIKKHRNGPTGVVDLFFEQNVASFRNLEKRREI